MVIVLNRINEVLSNTHNNEISLNTLEAALEIKSYYEAHAKRCYESVRGNTIQDAQMILELLKQKRLSSKFKGQDIYHQGLGGLSDSTRVREALILLQDYGWIISEKIQGRTGRQHEFWHLHPRAFE